MCFTLAMASICAISVFVSSSLTLRAHVTGSDRYYDGSDGVTVIAYTNSVHMST